MIHGLSEPGRRGPFQGILGTEGKLLAPGIVGAKPPVALLAAQEARMSVACCATYCLSKPVALGSERCVLPANMGAAAEITLGLLKSDGEAAAGLGT